MKFRLSVCFFVLGLNLTAQIIPNRYPDEIYYIDKSAKGEIAFTDYLEECDRLFEKEEVTLSSEEKEKLDDCIGNQYESYWDVLPLGCSWYCAGGSDSVIASSTLEVHKSFNYQAQNMHDLNYKTAWVEGAEGLGIGEKITYMFNPERPRITTIIIANGYVKSEKAWQNNARVQQLKVYLNDEPYAILHLEDSRSEQSFGFDPIGNPRNNQGTLLKTEPWKLTFEILAAYRGDKYEDTAITEIYFDGIDVH